MGESMSAIKHVCQLDSSGFYVGQVVADESPLEPGVFLVPAGCVDVAPPASEDGVMHRWDASVCEWVSVDRRAVAEDIHKQVRQDVVGERAVQFIMDVAARNAGYDSLLSAISYADETAVPAYAADGRKFRAWRSIVWHWFFSDEKALAGLGVAELEPLMPKTGG